jgi:hypothetical protein
MKSVFYELQQRSWASWFGIGEGGLGWCCEKEMKDGPKWSGELGYCRINQRNIFKVSIKFLNLSQWTLKSDQPFRDFSKMKFWNMVQIFEI